MWSHNRIPPKCGRRYATYPVTQTIEGQLVDNEVCVSVMVDSVTTKRACTGLHAAWAHMTKDSLSLSSVDHALTCLSCQGLELVSTTGVYETDENGKELCVWTSTVSDQAFVRLASARFVPSLQCLVHARICRALNIDPSVKTPDGNTVSSTHDICRELTRAVVRVSVSGESYTHGSLEEDCPFSKVVCLCVVCICYASSKIKR